MKELNPKISNTTALAYMGDAVCEILYKKVCFDDRACERG